jgi:hypothetical protein
MLISKCCIELQQDGLIIRTQEKLPALLSLADYEPHLGADPKPVIPNHLQPPRWAAAALDAGFVPPSFPMPGSGAARFGLTVQSSRLVFHKIVSFVRGIEDYLR